jgi:hypothetical protein
MEDVELGLSRKERREVLQLGVECLVLVCAILDVWVDEITGTNGVTGGNKAVGAMLDVKDARCMFRGRFC